MRNRSGSGSRRSTSREVRSRLPPARWRFWNGQNKNKTVRHLECILEFFGRQRRKPSNCATAEKVTKERLLVYGVRECLRSYFSACPCPPSRHCSCSFQKGKFEASVRPRHTKCRH